MVSKRISNLVQTSSATWKSSSIPGVKYIPLNADANERAGTFVLKMDPGVSYPKHRHPQGEEIFILKGQMKVGTYEMKAGDYLFSPPGSVHEASTKEGCIFVSILPKGIEIVPTSGPSEFDSSNLEG